MDSPQTLQDFVLNLISDPSALSAFQLDPDGALQAAGLSDINPADVQEVIPLVVDSVPLQNVAGLDGGALTGGALSGGALSGGALSSGALSGLAPDLAGATGQLQGVTSGVTSALPTRLPLTNLDLSTAAAGTLGPLGAAGLSGGLYSDGSAVYAGGSAHLNGPVHVSGSLHTSGDFSATNDIAHTLDSGVLSGTDGLTSSVSGTLDDSSHLSHGLPGVESLTGTLDGLTGNLDGVTGTVGGLTGNLNGVTGAVTGGAHPLDTGHLLDVGGLTGGLTDSLGGLTGGLTGALPTAGPATDAVSGASHDGSSLHASGSNDLLGHVGPVSAGATDGHLLDVTHLL